jgi:predicted dienelactone hydrolase
MKKNRIGFGGAIALSISVLGSLLGATPSQAAENITLRFGPFEQTVKVSEIETYANTGQLSPNLQLFSPFLTPEVRKGLTTKLNLDPKTSGEVVGKLLKSPAGQQLMTNVQSAAPGLTPELLQVGVSLAAQQLGGLNAIGIVKAIPTDTLTIDLSQAAALGSKINLSYWKSQALGTLLEKSLIVEGEPANFNQAIDPTAPGPIAFSKQSYDLVDTARKDRSIPVDVYLSRQPSPQTPTVVISPGFEASRNFLGYLGQHFASHGIHAIVVEHPTVIPVFRLAALDLEKLLPAQELLDRPKDLQFAIDQLGQNPELKTKLNLKQLVIAGHSMGGYDALALAGGELNFDELRQFCNRSRMISRSPADWLQCAGKTIKERTLNLRDSRVVGAIALNPVAGRIFGPTGLSKVQTPVFMLTSTDDGLTPTFDQQLQPFMQLPQPKYLLTAIAATHLSVSDRLNVGQTLVKERTGQEMEPLRAAVRGTSLAFVKQFTADAQTYKPFLSAGYAQFRSTPEIPMRLNAELPTSITRLLNLAGMF